MLYCGMRTRTWTAVVVKYIAVHRIAQLPMRLQQAVGLQLLLCCARPQTMLACEAQFFLIVPGQWCSGGPVA